MIYPHLIVTMIEAFGDQAFHKGVRMMVECVHENDPEGAKQISDAVKELMKLGYHKFPRED